MEVKYNVSGERRKEMVKAVSEALDGWSIEYLGAPTFSYQVGDFEITKDGTLVFSDRTDSKMVEDVLEALEQRGFEFEEEHPRNTSQFAGPYEMPWDEDCNQKEMTDEEMAEAMEEQESLFAEAATAPQAEAEPVSLSISMPKDSFTDVALENLDHLLEGKGSLIKKAFGIEEATYTFDEDKVTFNWLHGEITPEKAKAAQDFISKLCEMARTQKRVTAKAKAVDNEKYAFRCFLLRLGLIGAEYKTTRKILMANLSGNASFKSGHKKEAAESNETTEG